MCPTNLKGKLAYFVHIAGEAKWGELYGRTLLYTTSLARLNPIYPEFTLKIPVLPQISSSSLKLGEKLAPNGGTQHLAHAGLIPIRSQASDQLTPGCDQKQDFSDLIKGVSAGPAERHVLTPSTIFPSPALLFPTPPPTCCLIWATFLCWARRSCLLGHNLRTRTHFHVFGSFDAYSTSRPRPVIK